MLRIRQVAERLNCSVSTAYSLIETGKLAHHRCCGIRVSEDQLAAYLDETKREPEPHRRIARSRPRLKHITL